MTARAGGCAVLSLLLISVPVIHVPAWAEDASVEEKSLWQTIWSLPAEDQKSVGVCLHMYLERDYPEIERIVYPVPRPSSSSNDEVRHRVLLDGPGLEINCQHLKRLLYCFGRSLSRMHYYENFVEFRRLVTALDAVLLQLCGAVDLMRHRFLPLLQTMECIERVRAAAPCGARLPSNLWHKLVRLEVDSTLCWPLARQLRCVGDSQLVRYRCGDTAQQLFANLSGVFLAYWCFGAGAAGPGAQAAPPLLALLAVAAALPALALALQPRSTTFAWSSIISLFSFWFVRHVIS